MRKHAIKQLAHADTASRCRLESGAFPALDPAQQPAKPAAEPVPGPAASAVVKPLMSFAAALSGKSAAKPAAAAGSSNSEGDAADSRQASQRGDWDVPSPRQDGPPALADAEDVMPKIGSQTGGWDILIEDDGQQQQQQLQTGSFSASLSPEQPQAEGYTSARSSLEDEAYASRPFSRCIVSPRLQR